MSNYFNHIKTLIDKRIPFVYSCDCGTQLSNKLIVDINVIPYTTKCDICNINNTNSLYILGTKNII